MSLIDKITNLPLPVLNHWGYWVVLLGVILESNPLTGLVVPGMTLVILGGFFAKLGILEIGDVIWVAALGAIIGDLIGYYMGKNYGYSFIKKYGKYFFFKKKQFEKTKKLMNHHTGKALIIGRFNSLTRAFAPFIAGSTGVPFLKFLVYNIIGGISWGIAFAMIGYIFGKSYELVSQYIGKFIVIAIVVSILFIYLYKFINKRKHIFTKYHLYALILNIFSLYLFSKMVEDVIDGELITKLDIWINAKMVLLWSPLLNKMIIFITNIASPSHLFVLSIILFGFLIYKKKWYHSLLLLFSMMGGLLFKFLIKIVIHRARPENALIEISGYSFPSGHATMAIIFFSLLLYSFKDNIKNKIIKNTFIIINITLFLLVGFSRVYLNVHWFSDVIAGLALGLFWLTFVMLVFKIIISLSTKTLEITKNRLNEIIPRLGKILQK